VLLPPGRRPKPLYCRSCLGMKEVFQKTKYSRIPVYDGEIDKIIGVAMSKVGPISVFDQRRL
jgi:hypothetical protein